MSDDDDSQFMQDIKSNDHRRQLVAMRDLMAQELDGNRCRACQMLQMRSGEIAALVLRLQKVIEEIKTLPVLENGEPKKTGLELIRGRRDEDGDEHGPRGSKSDARRQGGRRTGN